VKRLLTGLVALAPLLAWSAAVTEVPFRFVPNGGEYPPEVRFVARDAGCVAQFLDSGVNLRLWYDTNTPQEVKVRFAGASSDLTVQSAGEGSVVYSNVYPGIDVKYFGRMSEIEDAYIVHVGADPSNIRVVMEGARELILLPDGTLVIETGAGQVEERRPMAYQDVDGQHIAIECGFRRLSTNTFGFRVGTHNLGRDLIID
jgi:hypothetical protein